METRLNTRPKYRVKKFSNACLYRFTAIGVTRGSEHCIWWSTKDATYQLYPKNVWAWIHYFAVAYIDYHIQKYRT